MHCVQGSKIRASYIKYAAAEKVKLQERVKTLEDELRGKEGEVEAARGTSPFCRGFVSHG
jgi:hypothetical protein